MLKAVYVYICICRSGRNDQQSTNELVLTKGLLKVMVRSVMSQKEG